MNGNLKVENKASILILFVCLKLQTHMIYHRKVYREVVYAETRKLTSVESIGFFQACVCVCVCARMGVHMCVFVCTCVCMSVCSHVCVCAHVGV